MIRNKSCSHLNVIFDVQITSSSTSKLDKSQVTDTPNHLEYNQIEKLFDLIIASNRTSQANTDKKNIIISDDLKQFRDHFCRECCQSPIKRSDKPVIASRLVRLCF